MYDFVYDVLLFSYDFSDVCVRFSAIFARLFCCFCAILLLFLYDLLLRFVYDVLLFVYDLSDVFARFSSMFVACLLFFVGSV